MGCSDARMCYHETSNSPPGNCCQPTGQMFVDHECSACATAKGLCDDCFPESPCGGPPPDPPAPPATYWTIIGRPSWATHSSGEKHPECLPATSTTSAQSNK